MAPLLLKMVIGVVLVSGTQGKMEILSKTEIVTDSKCGKEGSKEHIKGAVYVRWGHYRCPPKDTELVFSGYVGGSAHNRGGAVDYLCLSRNPTPPNDTRKFKHYGVVYGAEYDLVSLKGIELKKHNYDVPCAVCQSQLRTNTFMLSGRDVCPKGWHLEYKGSLMSGYIGYKASKYTCVDIGMKTLPGTKADHISKLFFPVIARCGSLKCPPYKEGQTLNCAVCTN